MCRFSMIRIAGPFSKDTTITLCTPLFAVHSLGRLRPIYHATKLVTRINDTRIKNLNEKQSCTLYRLLCIHLGACALYIARQN